MTHAPVLTLNGPADSLILRPMVAEKPNGRPYVFIRVTNAEGRLGVSVPLSEFYRIADWMKLCAKFEWEHGIFPDARAEWR